MRRSLEALAYAGLLAACAGVQPQQVEKQKIYLLEARSATDSPRPKTDLVIEVEMPRARAGFDTNHMSQPLFDLADTAGLGQTFAVIVRRTSMSSISPIPDIEMAAVADYA